MGSHGGHGQGHPAQRGALMMAMAMARTIMRGHSEGTAQRESLMVAMARAVQHRERLS